VNLKWYNHVEGSKSLTGLFYQKKNIADFKQPLKKQNKLDQIKWTIPGHKVLKTDGSRHISFEKAKIPISFGSILYLQATGKGKRRSKLDGS
jgi:hypothetical protein